MTDEQSYKLAWWGIFWGGVFMIVLVVSVAAYNITDRIGPVKPYVHQEYSWPGGTPSK